ncbi:MAG: hypothetical protein J5527_11110 [Treponema sp.]|nr:hypothetical protein [Treponema sp.]
MALFIIILIVIKLLPEKSKDKLSAVFDKEEKLPLSYIYKIVFFLNSLLVIVNFIPKYGFNDAKIKNDYLYDSQNERVLIYQDSDKSIFMPRSANGSFEKKYIIVPSDEMLNISLEHYNQTIQFETIVSDVVIEDSDYSEEQ